jgi:hypothetical protein
MLTERGLRGRGESGLQTVQRSRLRLPTSLGSTSTATYELGGDGDEIPATVRPPTRPEEEELLNSIICETREKLAVDLDLHLSFDRWPPLEDSSEADVYNFMVIGSSHASKIGAALTHQGHKVTTVYEANWRVFKNNATFLAETVNARLVVEKVDYIVFPLLATVSTMLWRRTVTCSRPADVSTAPTTCMEAWLLGPSWPSTAYSKLSSHYWTAPKARGRHCCHHSLGGGGGG